MISRSLGWDRADWTDHLRVIEALRGKRPAVWHIHGDFDRPKSIIFSQNDYDRIVASELPQFVQKSAGLDFTLVFVGCSGSGLSDDNVGHLLGWMQSGLPASATGILFSSPMGTLTSGPRALRQFDLATTPIFRTTSPSSHPRSSSLRRCRPTPG